MWTVSCPSFLSSKMMHYVDWFLIGLSIVLAALRGSYTFSPEISLQIHLFHSIFFLMSFWNPLARSRQERCLYVGLFIGIFSIAASLSLSFSLQMYWFLAKSCLLFQWRGALMTILLNGMAFLGAYYLDRYDALALVAEQGIDRWLNPNAMFFNQLGFYLGGSSLMMVFAMMIVAEQRSRHKAESLTQQVTDLAARLERTRIAREIHDSLGHSLTSLNVQLELAQRLHDQDSAKSEQALRNAQSLTQQCLLEVRNSVQSIRDPRFDLNIAIANLVNTVSQNQAFIIQLELDVPPLPSQVGHQLYCIVQEGLTNIQKHAKATQVELMGYQHQGNILLILTDNGQGFLTQHQMQGFGIRGMQERAQILGGTLLLQSSLGAGTSVKIEIPYSVEAL